LSFILTPSARESFRFGDDRRAGWNDPAHAKSAANAPRFLGES
jgi:hypothetical protein